MTNPVIVQLIGDAPILEKIMLAMLQVHLERHNGYTSPGCWVNAYDFSSKQLGAIFGPKAIFAIVN